MQDLDFFEGKRPLAKVVFILNKGKTTITCTPWEEWRLLEPCPFTLRCGNAREEKVTQRVGIEHSQTTSFESTVGSSLGQKGVAALESSLKSTLGQEIKFQAGTEREQTFTFDSPKCGYKVVRLYQQVRALHIDYRDTRFWHRDANELTLVHWLKSIYDATHAEQHDPRCNCDDVLVQEPRSGTAARVVSGAAAKLAVQWSDNYQLEFADVPLAIDSYFNWGRTVDGRLPTDVLPDYLRFLAGIEPGKLAEAQVWQEAVQAPMTPGMRSPSEITIELDDEFQRIEVASGLHQATETVPEQTAGTYSA
ncbi:MAG: hypothetical protein QOK29_1443 [Rhodospirillaceae bacterium]|jgi:hypothetical protein|nr:hypothetical protein [Rhodospirillaceae bacterium]